MERYSRTAARYIDGSSSADARGVAALLEVPADAADRESQPGLDGPRERLLLDAVC